VSSYIDHREARAVVYDVGGGKRESVFEPVMIHSWADHTRARLKWLYGPQYAKKRARQTMTDVAAWNALGARSAA